METIRRTMKHIALILALAFFGCAPDITRPEFTILTPGQKSQVGISAPVVYSFTIPYGSGIMFTDDDSLYIMRGTVRHSFILPKHAGLWPGELLTRNDGIQYVIYSADGQVAAVR
jgi:hypothetical protein